MVSLLSLISRNAVDDILHYPKTKSESFLKSASPLS